MKQSFIDAFEYKAWANQELLDFGSRQFDCLPEEDATFFVRILNHTAVVDAVHCPNPWSAGPVQR